MVGDGFATLAADERAGPMGFSVRGRTAVSVAALYLLFSDSLSRLQNAKKSRTAGTVLSSCMVEWASSSSRASIIALNSWPL